MRGLSFFPLPSPEGVLGAQAWWRRRVAPARGAFTPPWLSVPPRVFALGHALCSLPGWGGIHELIIFCCNCVESGKVKS